MKEFNLEAANRKFLETILFFKKDDELETGYCYSITQHNNDITYLIHPDSTTTDPEYITPENGFYTNEKTELCLVTKTHKKTFKIGCSIQTHSFQIITNMGPINNNHWHYTKLNKKIFPTNEQIETALSQTGLISDTMWVSPDKIFYLNQPIGYRKGTTFIVNTSLRHIINSILQPFKVNLV